MSTSCITVVAGTIPSFAQSEVADLDYAIDWSAHTSADAIVTSVWAVPAGLTGHDQDSDATSATIWLRYGSGALNTRHRIRNTITTVAGRKYSKSFYLTIVDD